MTLFKNDLYRNFGIGFLVGGAIVAWTNPALKASLLAVVL